MMNGLPGYQATFIPKSTGLCSADMATAAHPDLRPQLRDISDLFLWTGREAGHLPTDVSMSLSLD
jgi:hypothetical protein